MQFVLNRCKDLFKRKKYFGVIGTLNFIIFTQIIHSIFHLLSPFTTSNSKHLKLFVSFQEFRAIGFNCAIKVINSNFLRPVYTGDFCHSNSMQFLSQQNHIKFQTCSKPLRYRGDKSHLVYTCNFEAATLAQQKLRRVAATKIACVKGPSHRYLI